MGGCSSQKDILYLIDQLLLILILLLNQRKNPFVNLYEPIDPNVVYFDQPGMNVTVKSWCSTYGPQLGFMITHYEVFSITQFFTVKQGDKVIYRPTCNYAYHPAPDAMASTLELIGSGEMPEKKDWKVLQQQIVTGWMNSECCSMYGQQLTRSNNYTNY